MRYIETIQMLDNKPQNLSYHLSRMKQSSSVRLPDLEALNPQIEGRVKCRIIYSLNQIISIEFSPYALPKIGSLELVEAPQIIYDKKYLDRSSLDELYTKRTNADDILICQNGFIGDSYFCNIIFRERGGNKELFTSSTPLLAGTKRQKLIDEGLVKVRKISKQDLPLYEGGYLINAMIDLSDEVFIPISNIY